jgi:multiple sugar transport system substrate-binding protein
MLSPAIYRQQFKPREELKENTMAENKNTLSRRNFLRRVGQVSVGLAGASVLAACATPTPQIVKETVIVEKPVEKVVQQTVVVPQEVGAKTIRITVNANFFLEADAFNEAKVWTVHVPEFNATHKDIKIIVEPVSGAEYVPKVPLMAQTGDIPDILWMTGDPVAVWAAGGVLMPLDDLIAKDKFDLGVFNEAALATVRYDPATAKRLTGPLWGLGITLNAGLSMVWWNADVFAAKGVALPAENATLDDLVNIGKQLTQDKNGDGTPDIWGFSINHGNRHGISNDNAWIVPFGGEVINREGTKALLNSSAAMQGWQWYYDLYWTHKISPPRDIVSALGQYKEMHMKGQLAMYREGHWGGMHFNLIPAKGKEGHIEAGGMPWPKGPSGKNGTYVTTEPWGIAKATKYPAEAFEALKWVTDVESNKIRSIGTNAPPIRKDVVIDEALLKQNPWIPTTIKAAANAESPYYTANGRDSEVNRLLGQEMAAIDTNAAKPTQAFFDELAKKVQEILDKPKL